MSREPTTWLSTSAASKRLGVTPRTLYRQIDEGEVPAYRFGRVIRLRQLDLDAYINSSRLRRGDEGDSGTDPDDDEDDPAEDD